MATRMLNIPAIQPFYISENEASSLSQRWSKWRRGFEIYIIASAVTDNTQRKALLLHFAGEQVQELFGTFPDHNKFTYDESLQVLNDYFEPKKNLIYERYLFKSCKQSMNESTDQYATRLRKLSETCDFKTLVEEEVRDQIVTFCFNSSMRRRFLREVNLTLENLLSIARNIEMSEYQANKIEIENSKPEILNNVKIKSVKCYCCGRNAHFVIDPSCPANNKVISLRFVIRNLNLIQQNLIQKIAC